MSFASGGVAVESLDIAAWLLLVLALLGALYAAVAAELVRRKLRGRDVEPQHWPSVTLLKPLHGAHSGLETDLESFLAQDYPAPVQVLFGVRSADDAAYAVARNLCDRHGQRDLRVVVDPRLHGANRKVSNLINLQPHIRRDAVVLSDSDIRVGPDYLRRVVAALEQPGVGAVTCLYVGRPEGRELIPRLSALGTDQHFLPNVCLGMAIGLARPCFGSTIALRRETLAAIGGFAAFADLLADDYEIGRAVRALGLTVAAPSFVVEHAAGEGTLRELIAHELRWARTIKRIDPGGHVGTLVTNPLPLALIGAALARGSLPALSVVAAVLIARFWLASRVAAATGRSAGPLWLTPIRDILSFSVYIASFGGDSVTWGGERFRTDSRGAMRPPTR